MGDLYVYDSSGARLFVVKGDVENKTDKIYMISRDEDKVKWESWIQEDLTDFYHSHHQSDLMLGKKINESHLIGEMKDNKFTKASMELTNFDLIKSCIVDTLIDEGKMSNVLPRMNFEELLNNFTLQKDYYNIKERAFVEMLGQLKMSGDVLTYEGFSHLSQIDDLKIKNEDFSIYSSKDVMNKIERNRSLKLSDLPQDYKDEINEYMDGLLIKYDNDTTKIIVGKIRQELDGVNKKLKP